MRFFGRLETPGRIAALCGTPSTSQPFSAPQIAPERARRVFLGADLTVFSAVRRIGAVLAGSFDRFTGFSRCAWFSSRTRTGFRNQDTLHATFARLET